MNQKFLRLLYVSSLALFLELLLVRYLGVEIKFFLFFKNFVLMASFLGLGLGIGMARRPGSVITLFPLVTALSIIAVFAKDLGINDAFIPTGSNAFLWYHPSTPHDWGELIAVFVLSLALTLLVTVVFLPLGRELGRLLDALPASKSYAWDLSGSILGVVAYSATAFLGLSPKAGIVLVLVGAIPLLTERTQRLIALALTAALMLVLCTQKTAPDWEHPTVLAEGTREPEYWWSPYHRVHWIPYSQQVTKDGGLINPGYLGFLNDHYYFDLLDFNLVNLPERVALIRHTQLNNSDMRAALAHYSVPYTFLPKLEHVLLLGAGPGNDAAVALMHGASAITAVEIDPAVVRLGREVHPMKPYLDPRVHVVVDDARAFMARCNSTFDMVSFGHLDSINLVNSFSSVRADSYIYTKESMRRAYELVKPGGILSVSFAGNGWIEGKINALLIAAAGRKPYVLQDLYMNTTTFILRKPGGAITTEQDLALFNKVASELGTTAINTFDDVADELVPTDDWPFLFLRERVVSPYHVVALALLVLFAALSTRVVYSRGRAGRVLWNPFWLGVGFMLIETKSLTELGLLFGSTWVVTAIGIIGVLIMNLIALATVRRFVAPPLLLYGLLLAAIALNLIIPLGSLLAASLQVRLVLAIVLVYAPLLFAGAAFARTFASTTTPSLVFGSNLLGAMIGGTLEYLSVALGFKALWMIAALVYLLAFAADALAARASLKVLEGIDQV